MLTATGHAEHNLQSITSRHVIPTLACAKTSKLLHAFTQAVKTTAHPMLAMVANCEQPLTTRYSRRLITLQKVQPYNAELEQLALSSEQSLR